MPSRVAESHQLTTTTPDSRPSFTFASACFCAASYCLPLGPFDFLLTGFSESSFDLFHPFALFPLLGSSLLCTCLKSASLYSTVKRIRLFASSATSPDIHTPVRRLSSFQHHFALLSSYDPQHLSIRLTFLLRTALDSVVCTVCSSASSFRCFCASTEFAVTRVHACYIQPDLFRSSPSDNCRRVHFDLLLLHAVNSECLDISVLSPSPHSGIGAFATSASVRPANNIIDTNWSARGLAHIKDTLVQRLCQHGC